MNAAPKKPVSMPAPKPVAPAARAPQKSNLAADRSFFREVDDALNQERLASLWQQYRYFFVAGLLFLLVATAGWQGWSAYHRHQVLAQAEQYYTWSQQPDANTRLKTLPALLGHSSHGLGGGYHALAIFWQAQQLAKTAKNNEDLPAADRAYGQLYNDASQPQWLRELARLNAALLLLGRNDTLAQEHLSILTQQPSSPQDVGATYPIALELLAFLAQRHGDVPTARALTERLLALPALPNDLRQRGLARLGELTPPVH